MTEFPKSLVKSSFPVSVLFESQNQCENNNLTKKVVSVANIAELLRKSERRTNAAAKEKLLVATGWDL